MLTDVQEPPSLVTAPLLVAVEHIHTEETSLLSSMDQNTDANSLNTLAFDKGDGILQKFWTKP